MKYLALINPAAGKNHSKAIIDLLKKTVMFRDGNLEFLISKKSGHIMEFTSENAARFDFIISVGGDGTINEAINGILNNGSKPKFLPIPAGSGNDFASNFIKSKNFRHIISRLEKFDYTIKSVDSFKTIITNKKGESIQRSIANVIGIGFDAYVAHLNASKKALPGVITYVIAVFKALKKLKSFKYNILFDGREYISDAILVSIGNCITTGGGFYLNPDAIYNDGYGDITTISPISKLKLIQKLPLALINKLKGIKEANFYKFQNFEMTLDIPMPVHLDGEPIEKEVVKVTAFVEHNSLSVVEMR